MWVFRSILFAALGVAPLWAVGERCLPCHAKQVMGYRTTGMARSISSAVPVRNGAFNHTLSGARFQVRIGENGMTHAATWRGLQANYRIDYAIGSGRTGHSYFYLWRGTLFQSPVAFYTSRGDFGMSPGYDQRRVPDFERTVGADCLFCHTAQNGPLESLTSIDCERCHGNAEAHLTRPSVANVINPARLRPAERDSICEQCHLGGESRILNPGRKFAQFRPGEVLETIFTTYVDAEHSAGGARVASHSEEIAASRCGQATQARMWCGTCHNPHATPSDPEAWYRQRCLSCHVAVEAGGHGEGRSCTVCHMPKRPPSDVPHTTFTDHRILRKPSTTAPSPPGRRLQPWRTPPAAFRERNLGLGYIGAGERLQSTALLNEGLRILGGGEKAPDQDAVVLTAIGTLLLQNGKASRALVHLRQAAQKDPSARSLMNLAVALHANGQPGPALTHLEQAITKDPLMEEGYIWLVEFYRKAGRQADASEAVKRWREAYPESFGPHLAGARQ
jgi:tetratricopeptide (TPR) repeat protein